jgi:hypothetical protein
MKILFLLKRNYDSAGAISGILKSGLVNSVIILSEALQEQGQEVKMHICIDGNSIDKEVYNYRPDVCIIEAIWVTPAKLRQIQKLHPTVLFITRIHSKIPFLANEGNSLSWIKEYLEIPNVLIASNNYHTNRDFNNVGIPSIYLPNVYKHINIQKFEKHKLRRPTEEISIASFGAIRPLKNQLLQAFAAIHFANKYNLKLNFHINSGRIEQQGDSVLKNIRAIFDNISHSLVEHKWSSHEEFLNVVSTMDIGMQCSYTESYNIVAADFVSQGIPIVVSDEIYWMPCGMKADMNDSEDIVKKLKTAYLHSKHISLISAKALNKQRGEALFIWNRVLLFPLWESLN